MRLLRYGPPGAEKPGLVDREGRVRDLSAAIAEFGASATAADIGPDILGDAALDRLRALDPASLPLVAGTPRIGPCVTGTSKVIGVGLNYADHAAEAGLPVPPEPVLFMKATSAISGPFDPVVLPRGSTKVDWEVELGVVIGTKARYVDEASALDHVAGYCVVNDVSERAFQMERAGQWVKGKSADTFCPLGPWLVTRDEVPDPQALGLWLEVDGVRRQNGSTVTMVYGVRTLVSYISRFMTLLPGDVIATGTPPGVGLGRKPPVFLKPGAVMRLGVDGLGWQRQEVVADTGEAG